MDKTNILLETGTNEFEIIEFVIDNSYKTNKTPQSFAVNVAKVREIIRMPELTKMPDLPDVVLGIFRLRGDIYPAIDLCKYLYDQAGSTVDRKMIITEFNNLKVGFIVDEVKRIHRITWSQIISADSITEFNTDNTTSIIGLVKIEENNVLMLDVEKIVVDINPKSAIDDFDISFEIFNDRPIAITAEDSAVIRKMITEKLKLAGFEIESYNDGEATWHRMLEIAKEVEDGKDIKSLCKIVITDVEMPKMDGYTLTKNIKTHPILKQIPVVLFSSLITADVLHKGKSVGADAQMTKPQIGELLEVIKTLINNPSLVNKNHVV